MGQLKAAIIGAGLIAGKKHIPAFLKHKSKVQLAAVCDLNLQAAQTVADRFAIPKAYGDVFEMLSKEKPDLVDICTPPQTHARLAVGVMENGCHVLIEKPMALTVADCDAIVQASQKCGVKVCVGHSDLFYPPFIKARELVGSGAIGEFRGMRIFLSTPTDYMTSQKNHWAHQLPGGVIGETGPHVVYMTLAFIDPVRRVSVDTMKIMNFPWSQYDDYRINLIGDKAISSITLSYATDQWMARLDLLGSKGILTLDLEGMYIVDSRRKSLDPVPIGLSVLSESGQMVRDLLMTGVRVAAGTYQNTHDIIVERFVESIVKDVESPVTAVEGREAVRVLNMIVDKLQESVA